MDDRAQTEANIDEEDFSIVAITKALKLSLPLYLTNLLKVCGHDNWLSFEKMSDSLIKEMEIFAREELKDLVDSTPDNFGIYYKNIEKFKIVGGDRLKIFHIADYVRKQNKVSSKNALKLNQEPNKTLQRKDNTSNKVNTGQNIEQNRDQKSTTQNDISDLDFDLDEEKEKLNKMVADIYEKFLILEGITEDIPHNKKDFKIVSFNESVSSGKCLATARVECFCKSVSTIQYVKDHHSTKWVYSNIRKHFKQVHCLKKQSQYSKMIKKSKTDLPITHFFSIDNKHGKTLNSKIENRINASDKINIIHDISLTTVDRSQGKSNKTQNLISSDQDENDIHNNMQCLDDNFDYDKHDKLYQVNSDLASDNIGQNTFLSFGEKSKEKSSPNNKNYTTVSRIDDRIQDNVGSNISLTLPEDILYTDPDVTTNNEDRIGNKNDISGPPYIEPTPDVNEIKIQNPSSDIRSDYIEVENSNFIQKTNILANIVNSDLLERPFNKPMTTRSTIITRSKWKQSKYSRVERKQRKLLIGLDPQQKFIPEYYPLIDEIYSFFISNEDVAVTFNNQFKSNNTSGDLKPLLHQIMKCAASNGNKNPQAYRYDKTLKRFCTYLFLIGGRLSYETLHANLKSCIPSLSTVRRNIDDEKNLIQGEFRFKELRQFLIKRKYPLKVFISEDQTGITSKISYDPTTNNLVGFAPPLDINGFPMKNYFEALSPIAILNHFENSNRSNNAYLIIAQPINDKAPQFCLNIFGSSNKFTHLDIINRWTQMQALAQLHGIEILGFASDGDSRLLSAMKIKSFISEIQINCDWSCADFTSEDYLTQPIYFQDIVHIGTKLKNRLFKPSIILPAGDFVISLQHLRSLTETLPKDQHCLTANDFNSKDKMNFDVVEKIVAPSVINLLEAHIPDSKSTVLYLRLIQYTLDSFLEKSLSPLERIFKIWYVVFILRRWRYWLKKQDNYTLKGNFISTNAYTCVEINAHNLIKLIIKLKQSNEDDLFFPWIMSSQPCEKTFRAIRSLTSTFSTIVNFNMLEILHRLKRVQLINEIQADTDGEYIYPREIHRKLGEGSTKKHKLPDLNEVFNIVEKAKNKALDDSILIGMKFSESSTESETDYDWYKADLEIKIASEDFSNLTDEEDDDFTLNEEDENKNDDIPDNISEEISEDIKYFLPSFCEQNHLKKFDLSKELNCDQFFRNSAFTQIVMRNGKSYIIRKSSLCWMLENQGKKLSSDRLLRVQQSSTQNTETEKENNITKKYQKIFIGDWCVFSNKTENLNNFIVGRVLAFSYLNGKTNKQKEYSLRFCEIRSTKKRDKKGIGCLANWLTCDQEGNLTFMNNERHNFMNINLYICTLREIDVEFKSKTLKISPEAISIVTRIVNEYYVNEKTCNQKGKSLKHFVKCPDQKKIESSEESDCSSSCSYNTDNTSDEISNENDEISNENDEISDESRTLQVKHKKDLAQNFEIEKYYATYYREGQYTSCAWYVGRIIKKISEKTMQIKFLRRDLDRFVWPRESDVQIVETRYIFYGPISLSGCGPFYVKKSDEIQIEKKIKEMKM